jgi:hypothetical protein
MRRCGEQFFGIWVAPVNRKYLFGEHVGRRSVSAVQCVDRAIEQFIDATHGVGLG